MDLDLTDEQALVRDTTRAFLEKECPFARVRALADDPRGVDPDLWARAGELGWFAAFVPEAHGGGSVSGAPAADTAIVVEEAGRVDFPGPVIPTNVVADAIARSGSDTQRAEHLPGLAAGSRIATWAFAEPDGRWSAEAVALEARRDGDHVVLSGTKSFVQDAGVADLLLVTARTADGLSQVLVPSGTAGVSVSPLRSLDLARRFAEVHFADVRVPATAVVGDLGGAADAVERQLDLATALVCAETVGALDRAFEMTLAYAKDRKAFGRPIGSFQALKHRFADLLLWLEGSKAVAGAAAAAVDHDDAAARAEMVAIAKSYVAEHGQLIVRDCVQLHGGIGYTWEYDLHLLLRRVESNAALYGGVDHHRDRLAALLGVAAGSRS